MESDDEALMRSTIVSLIDHAGGDDDSLTESLIRQGWGELAAAEPAAAFRALYDEAGFRLHCGSTLDLSVASCLGFDPSATRVVYPNPGQAPLRNGPADKGPAGGIAVGGKGHTTGIALGGWPALPPLNVVVLDEQITTCRFPRSSDAVITSTVEGLDPSLNICAVNIDLNLWDRLDELDGPTSRRTLASARRALAQQLLGSCRAMLSLTAAYSQSRQQFGAPLGSFQAVKHHLAEVQVALDSSQRALDVAWSTEDENASDLAKALAGEAMSVASRYSLQIFGAVGFSWEHSLHRYMRRGMTLDLVLGSARDWKVNAGRALIAGRSMPRLETSIFLDGSDAHVQHPR